MTPWYRWPENKETGLVPWFVAVRRLIFWPLLLVGMCIVWLAVAGGFSPTEAKRIWRNTK
jgi:hypothetical protein